MIPPTEVFEILELGSQQGFRYLDTAPIYGDSQQVIADYQHKYGNKFNVFSKVSTAKNYQAEFLNTLKILGNPDIYGILIHNANIIDSYPQIWTVMKQWKTEGHCQQIGLSLYHPNELLGLLKKGIIPDVVQAPFNIFDRRFQKIQSVLNKNKISFFARSIYLQGLVFIKPDLLPPYLKKIQPKIERLRSIAKSLDITVAELCLCFVLNHSFVDKVVIGVEKLQDLKDIVATIHRFNKIRNIITEFPELMETDEKLIIPSNWDK
jgi:aryl-alcohol dehydrogenase-like predicted oxidoreductase